MRMNTAAAASDHLVNLIGAFVTSVGDDLRATLEDRVGAGGAGPAALLAVDTWPGRSIDFLAGVLGLSHSGTVRLVDRLEEQELVRRQPGSDGRTAALYLAKRGQALARQVRRDRHRLLADLVAPLTGAERRSLGTALDRALRSRARSRREARHACRLCEHSVCREDACPIGASVRVD